MVVPLYNHAGYIEQAVSSVLAQGTLVRELLVIDDGSIDESATVMARLATRDGRIRFERQANLGAHATLNTALAQCDGELLAILNSDDVWRPGRLSALAAALDAGDGADIAASGIGFIDAKGAARANDWYEAAWRAHRDGTSLAVALLGGNFLMTTSNLLFRRAAWDAIGTFADLRYAHDLDWLLRAVALGRRIAIVDQPLLYYRMHDRNTISEDHQAVRVEWAMVAAAYLTMLWDRPGAPPIDWPHAAAAQAVLREHQLDRAVGPCMAYLRRHGAQPLDHGPMLADGAFRALVRDWV